MPKVTFVKEGVEIEVDEGANLRKAARSFRRTPQAPLRVAGLPFGDFVAKCATLSAPRVISEFESICLTLC